MQGPGLSGPDAGAMPTGWYSWLLAPPRFEPELESEYLYRWRLGQTLPLQRFSAILSTGIYVCVLLFEYFFGGRIDDARVFWTFGGLSIFMTVWLGATTFWPRLRSRAYFIGSLAVLVNGCALIAVTALSKLTGDPFPQAWTLVLLIYGFVMIGLPFRHCVPIGIALGLLDIAVGFGLGLRPLELIDHVLLDIAVVLTGMTACAMLERSDRLNWMRARQMQTQSYSDELTGLRNRRYMFEEGARRIEQAGREDLPVALLMVDVDYFKRYNDEFGHPAGDQCLRRVSNALMTSARRPLDICARIGGEEFAVLLFGCSQAAALKFAEGLRGDLEQLGIEHPGSPIGTVTASLGVAATDSCGKVRLEPLILAADQALYRAKQAGRNRVED